MDTFPPIISQLSASQMLAKKYRLSSEREINFVFKKGYRVRGKYGMLIGVHLAARDTLPTSGIIKIAFVLGKKIGKATERNLMKRRLRAISWSIIKTATLSSQNNIHIEYIAFKNCEDFDELQKEFSKQFNELILRLVPRK